MTPIAPRLYRHLKTGAVVTVTGLDHRTMSGRFITVYDIVRADGTTDAVPAETFHRQHERVKEEPVAEVEE